MMRACEYDSAVEECDAGCAGGMIDSNMYDRMFAAELCGVARWPFVA